MATAAALREFASALAQPCAAGACRIPELDAAAVHTLADAGIALPGYAAAQTLLAIVVIVLLWTMGTLVATRGSGASRWVVGAAWFAFAFGPVSDFSPWRWTTLAIAPAGVIGYLWLIALFPTGRPRPRWILIPAVAATLWTLLTHAVPPVATAIARGEQPWYGLVGPGFIVCVAALTAGQVVQFRSASPDARRAQGQLAVTLGLLVAAGSVGVVLSANGQQDPGSLPAGLLAGVQPFVTGITLLVFAAAIVRDRVYGVRAVLDNVLVGALVVAAAAVVFAATVVVASQVLQPGLASAAASATTAIVCAATFFPLRRAIDRLVYGEQDAASVVEALTARVAVADSADTVIPELLEQLRLRMRWPSVAFHAVADAPPPTRGTTSVMLGPADDTIGVLTVTHRAGQRRLTRRDRRILVATGAAFAAALSAMRLTRAAADARRETDTARERERADLRRRLHDGVGPSLAVARHLVQGLRSDLPTGAAAQRPLATADAALADAADQVRRISRELQPPALEDAGFTASLHALASGLGLDADVTGEDGDHRPADLRLALYRIAAEAFVNAARHGDARRVTLELARTGSRIAASISDDGVGMRAGTPAGVGITSMRERIANSDGTVDRRPRLPQGTVVDIVLRRLEPEGTR